MTKANSTGRGGGGLGFIWQLWPTESDCLNRARKCRRVGFSLETCSATSARGWLHICLCLSADSVSRVLLRCSMKAKSIQTLVCDRNFAIPMAPRSVHSMSLSTRSLPLWIKCHRSLPDPAAVPSSELPGGSPCFPVSRVVQDSGSVAECVLGGSKSPEFTYPSAGWTTPSGTTR
jgi:hypothetical protein